MSLEGAIKFLEEVAKNEKLAELLEEISAEDLEKALEEMKLHEVSGGQGHQAKLW